MVDGLADPIFDISDSVLTASHPASELNPILIASSTQDEINTLRTFLIPKGCWKIEDTLFDFGSSFIRPEVRHAMQSLFRLREEHAAVDPVSGQSKSPLLSIFGHADPVGEDEYNKFLSGRRASALYAMLTRRADIWEDLFQNTGKLTPSAKGDTWGKTVLSTMRQTVRRDQGSDKIEDILGEENNGGLRKQLFLDYMDYCCRDAKGAPVRLDAEKDFLGKGTGKDLKGDCQGCGEFNPVFLLSKYDKELLGQKERYPERDAKNQPNRRVMVLLFRPGVELDTKKWPCPTIKEGPSGCRSRFYSDGEERRRNREEERRFEEVKDTFACRFYDRTAYQSPCEILNRANLSHISLLLRSNSGAVPIKRRKYKIFLSPKRVLQGVTNDEGLVEHPFVPAGDYKLELEGLNSDIIVPTLPQHLSRRITRIPGLSLDNLKEVRIRLYDREGKCVPFARCLIKLDGANSYQDKADEGGFLNISVRDIKQCSVEWQLPEKNQQVAGMQPNSMVVYVDISDEDVIEAATKRLNNLGYRVEPPPANIATFQRDFSEKYGLRITGKLDSETIHAISAVHDGCPSNLF